MTVKPISENDTHVTIEGIFGTDAEATLFLLRIPCPYRVTECESKLLEPHYERHIRIVVEYLKSKVK